MKLRVGELCPDKRQSVKKLTTIEVVGSYLKERSLGDRSYAREYVRHCPSRGRSAWRVLFREAPAWLSQTEYGRPGTVFARMTKTYIYLVIYSLIKFLEHDNHIFTDVNPWFNFHKLDPIAAQ